MAIARWKQMRIWGIQKAGFDLEMARLNSSCNIPAARASIVFKNLADNSRVLDLQYRYETGYDRQFCRAYAFFLKLRAKPDTQLEDTEFQSAQFSSAIATWEPAPEPDEPPTRENRPAPARERGGASEPRQAFDDPQILQSENRTPTLPPTPSETTQIAIVSPPHPVLRNGPNSSAPRSLGDRPKPEAIAEKKPKPVTPRTRSL